MGWLGWTFSILLILSGITQLQYGFYGLFPILIGVIIILAGKGVLSNIWDNINKAYRENKYAKDLPRLQEEREAREKAEAVRKQQEEEQWQENIKTGKVNLGLADIYNAKGYIFLNNKQYDEAITHFNLAIENNPKYEDAYLNRGTAYREKGLYDKAINDWKKVISLNREDADAHFNIGLVYLDNKEDFESAYNSFNDAIQIVTYGNKIFDNNKKAMFYLHRGMASNNIIWKKKKTGGYISTSDSLKGYEAINDWKEVLKLDPNNSEANRLLLMTEQNLG